MLKTVEKTDSGKMEVLDPCAIRVGLDGFQDSYRVFRLYTTALAERHLGEWFAGVMGLVNQTSEIHVDFEIWTRGPDKDRLSEMWFVCRFRFGPNRFLAYTENNPENLRKRIENDENLVIPRFSSMPELRMKLGLSGA